MLCGLTRAGLRPKGPEAGWASTERLAGLSLVHPLAAGVGAAIQEESYDRALQNLPHRHAAHVPQGHEWPFRPWVFSSGRVSEGGRENRVTLSHAMSSFALVVETSKNRKEKRANHGFGRGSGSQLPTGRGEGSRPQDAERAPQSGGFVLGSRSALLGAPGPNQALSGSSPASRRPKPGFPGNEVEEKGQRPGDPPQLGDLAGGPHSSLVQRGPSAASLTRLWHLNQVYGGSGLLSSDPFYRLRSEIRREVVCPVPTERTGEPGLLMLVSIPPAVHMMPRFE